MKSQKDLFRLASPRVTFTYIVGCQRSHTLVDVFVPFIIVLKFCLGGGVILIKFGIFLWGLLGPFLGSRLIRGLDLCPVEKVSTFVVVASDSSYELTRQRGKIRCGHDIIIPPSSPPDLLLANARNFGALGATFPARVRCLGALVADFVENLPDPLSVRAVV